MDEILGQMKLPQSTRKIADVSRYLSTDFIGSQFKLLQVR